MERTSHGKFSGTRPKNTAEGSSRALILYDIPDSEGAQTLLHLRFRGKIAATGLKKTFIVTGGSIMDHITTAPMLAGLQERSEASYSKSTQK
jgi:hypothetical protein